MADNTPDAPVTNQVPQPVQDYRAKLVTDPQQQEQWSSVRQVDMHRAVTRGIAEYIRFLDFTDHTGRALKLAQVFDTWAEPEDLAKYPCAAVHSPETGIYDASNFAPITGSSPVTVDGYTLRQSAEFKLMAYLDVYCVDPNQRSGVVMGLEDALLPVDWMYGARLALPFYFGVHMDVSLESVTYFDSAESAQRKLRIAQLLVSASIPMIKPVKLPVAKTTVTSSVSTAPITDTPRRGVLIKNGSI